MTPSSSRSPSVITQPTITAVVQRVDDGKRVRRQLPVWGRLSVDRQLPFLVVYRRPVRAADEGTERLVTSEPSYMTCSGLKVLQPGIASLVRSLAEAGTQQFGAFLLLEVWAGHAATLEGRVTTADLRPGFVVHAQKGSADPRMTDVIEASLSRLRIDGRRAVVSSKTHPRCAPKRMSPLMTPSSASGIGCQVFGLEVDPIYRDPETGELFPRVIRLLRRNLSVALRRAMFEFVNTHTTHRPAHFHALGRSAVVKAVWDVDRQLADISDGFDFLLLVTPVNGEQAWHQFRRRRFERTPDFHYRPVPTEPLVLKRQLYRAPIERIEDPALAAVFSEKLEELDRQITMLRDRNTRRFLPGSLQQHGGVEPSLLATALEILDAIPPKSRDSRSGRRLSATEFADRARIEIGRLKEQMPGLEARVEIRPDVTGLMVSQGNLLVSSRSKIPESRVEALIQHEVGTHVLTYHNGRAQRMRLLSSGFAGYDALQEGLAVLAEYLVGGLSRPRLRLLAARVVAADHLINGASFVETFRSLHDDYGFAARTAFVVTMRIYRSGGLTKDVVYLRGLQQILEFVSKGNALDPLFVGKIAVQHIPIVRELQWRKVLGPIPLTPSYLALEGASSRLRALQGDVSLMKLVQRSQ